MYMFTHISSKRVMSPSCLETFTFSFADIITALTLQFITVYERYCKYIFEYTYCIILTFFFLHPQRSKHFLTRGKAFSSRICY